MRLGHSLVFRFVPQKELNLFGRTISVRVGDETESAVCVVRMDDGYDYVAEMASVSYESVSNKTLSVNDNIGSIKALSVYVV